MRRIIRAGRAGAPAFQRIRSEISDDLLQAIDAGSAGARLLCERVPSQRDCQKQAEQRADGFHVF